MQPLLVAFVGGNSGEWAIDKLDVIAGAGLAPASHVRVAEDLKPRHKLTSAAWVLRGVTSNERYVGRVQHEALASRQEGLGRPGSSRAALIPISKSPAWWDLPQDERRRIFEDSSHHVEIGLEYIPAVARRLHHGRDLGEPFDFLTWFEFAPAEAADFEKLVQRLRATEEWSYVEREIDIRLGREGSIPTEPGHFVS